MSNDIVIIGGGGAGINTGATARRFNGPNTKITIIRPTKDVTIACALPYVGHVLPSVDQCVIPSRILDMFQMSLVVNNVTDVDWNEKNVILGDGSKIPFGKLVFATGSNPIRPPIPGLDKKGAHFINKEIPQAKELADSYQDARNVVVVGGGFIGVEYAEELARSGKKVVIVEMLPHLLSTGFAKDYSKDIEEYLTSDKCNNVKVMTSCKLQEAVGGEKVEKVKVQKEADGSIEEIPCDLLIVSIGVAPEVELAKKVGLTVDKGGIVVDEFQLTNKENVFAVGDCSSKKNFFTGAPSAARLASIAMIESRIAGANAGMMPKVRKNPGVIGAFCMHLADFCVSSTGLTADAALAAGIPARSATMEFHNRHPMFMPDARNIKVTLVFKKDDLTLIGGQLKGGTEISDITNMLSAMIESKWNAHQVALVQLCSQPAMTPSPMMNPIIQAAETAIMETAMEAMGMAPPSK